MNTNFFQTKRYLQTNFICQGEPLTPKDFSSLTVKQIQVHANANANANASTRKDFPPLWRLIGRAANLA